MTRYIGALDQGTTSTRFLVFDAGGREVGRRQLEHRQILPRPGWVEHDPIEIAALTRAYRASTSKTNFCALGSVKTNIGHLDAGAGAAGLIKTALALMGMIDEEFRLPLVTMDASNRTKLSGTLAACGLGLSISRS